MEQSNKPEDDTDERKQKEESMKSEIVALEIQVEAKRKELQELRSVSDVHERKDENFLALYQLRFYGDTSSDDASDSDHGTEHFERSTGDFSDINEYAEQQDSRTSEEPIAVGSQGDVKESLGLYAQPVLSSTQPESASGSYQCLDLVIRQVDFSDDHILLSSTTFKLAIQLPHFFEGNHFWLPWATSDPVVQPLILSAANHLLLPPVSFDLSVQPLNAAGNHFLQRSASFDLVVQPLNSAGNHFLLPSPTFDLAVQLLRLFGGSYSGDHFLVTFDPQRGRINITPQSSIVSHSPLLIESRETGQRPIKFACQVSILLCRFFLLMPNTQERISKLLRFSASLLTQKQGQVVDKMINALKITYEELKQRVVFGKQNEVLIPAMAFETVIGKFFGLENYGIDEILGEFMTEILALADLHETTFTLEDDLLRHYQDREKSSMHFVQHLQNYRETRRYKQRRTKHLSSEIELEIKEMWTKNSHFVSLEIEQEWERLIDLCSYKMLERGSYKMLERGTVFDWIDEDEMAEDEMAEDEMAEDELPIVAKDFSIEMLERMVLIMRNETYHKEASKEWKAGKSSLTFWLEHHDQSTAAWQLLKEVQVRALQLGTRLSHQLSCMVTMMIKSQSSHDNQGIVNSLEKFFMSLEKFTEAQQDNAVINKLIMVMESATQEVTRLNEGERPDGNRLKGLSEPAIETNPEKTNEVLEKILNQAMRLELVFSHPYLPDSTVLPTEVLLSLVEPFLSLIENQMTSLEQEIDELELPSSSTAADVSVFNSHMELKIKEIWARLKLGWKTT